MSSSRAQTADPLGHLYASHHRWLRDWLRRKLGCVHTAADLSHDVFLRLLLAPEKTDSLRQPRAYLTTLAQNLLIDRARRETLEQAYLAELRLAGEQQLAHPSVEQTLLVLEALQQIAEALAGASDKAREAFLMHYLEGWSQTEVAEQLQVSTRMVHKYLAQCLLLCAGLQNS